MPKMTTGITGLRGNLERDDGIEVPYWGPSLSTDSSIVLITKTAIYILVT